MGMRLEREEVDKEDMRGGGRSVDRREGRAVTMGADLHLVMRLSRACHTTPVYEITFCVTSDDVLSISCPGFID